MPVELIATTDSGIAPRVSADKVQAAQVVDELAAVAERLAAPAKLILLPPSRPAEVIPDESDRDDTSLLLDLIDEPSADKTPAGFQAKVPDRKLIPNPDSENILQLPLEVSKDTQELTEQSLPVLNDFLETLSVEIPVLQDVAIEEIADPIDMILLSSRNVQSADPTDSEEPVSKYDFVAAELAVLFDETELEIEEEEFLIITNALISFDEERQEAQEALVGTHTESLLPKALEVADQKPKQVVLTAEVSAEYKPTIHQEEAIGIIANIASHFDAIDPEEADLAFKPLEQVLIKLKEVYSDPEAAPEAIELLESEATELLHEIITDFSIDLSDEVAREIIQILIHANSEVDLANSEIHGLTELFGTIGTFEGKRYITSFRKLHVPTTSTLGRIILVACKQIQEIEKPMAIAA